MPIEQLPPLAYALGSRVSEKSALSLIPPLASSTDADTSANRPIVAFGKKPTFA